MQEIVKHLLFNPKLFIHIFRTFSGKELYLFPILDTDFPQLIYLKNKLWGEIFNLISNLLENSAQGVNITARSIEAATIISTTIFETGCDAFLEALCESLSCLGSNGEY